MAEVPVTITGVLIDLYGRTISGPLKLVGSLVRSDVGVGGGPIIPPPNGGNGGNGRPPHPEHPIPPRVEHPIVLPPDPPIDPPTEPPSNPPSDNWQWVWVPTGEGSGRWTPGYVPDTGDAQPH